MDVLDLESQDNKELIITLADFPYICRICCLKRSDLKLFAEEDYLLELFHNIRKIDAHSRVEYPRNICNECIDKLEELSMFIDISKFNNASFVRNIAPKEESIDCADDIGGGTTQKSIASSEKGDKNMSLQKSQTCRICSSPASTLVPLKEKLHLMQVFQNITDIDVNAESNSSQSNSICNKCNSELEKISSFVSRSLCNDQKLEEVIGRNEMVKTENYSNPIDVGISTCQGLSVIDKNEALTENASREIAFVHENRTGAFPEERPSKASLLNEMLGEEGHSSMETQNTDNGEKPFECHRCKKRFSQKHYLKQHMLTHTGGNTFGCSHCQKTFAVKRNLQKHLFAVHGEKPLKCDSCKKSFHLKSNLKRHILDYHGGKPYNCGSCEKSFKRKYHLAQHVITHSGEKPFKCNFCDRSFAQKSKLEQHVLAHTGELPFKCGCCERGFTSEPTLRKHLLTLAARNPFKCEYCRKRFSRKRDLEQHELTHTGDEPFECDRCKKTFTRKNYLQQHMVTHNKAKDSHSRKQSKCGETPFKCGCCEKSFMSELSLRKHLLSLAGTKPFRCDCCKERFAQKSHLKQHMLTHSGDRLQQSTNNSQKPFKCYICEHFFTQKSSLKQHMLIHTGERPLKCDSCKESFTNNRTLQKHVLVDHGDKPFECDCCENSSTQQCSLKRHAFPRSGDKPFVCDCCENCSANKQSWRTHLLTVHGEGPFKCDCCDKSFSKKGNFRKHMLTHTEERPFECDCRKKMFTVGGDLKQYVLTLGGNIQTFSECVRSSVEYPRNICNGCINKLKDISVFIEISKHNDATFGKNMQPKSEIVECKDEIESIILGESTGTTEENETDVSIHGSRNCRICLYPGNSLTPLEEKLDLMQLFQNITSINVTAESNSLINNCICNKCDDELESISLFISSSQCKDRILEKAIEGNETVTTANYSNPTGTEISACRVSELGSGIGGIESMIEDNLEKNLLSYEIEEDVDIKEEVTASELATFTEPIGLKSYSQSLPEEEPFDQQNGDNEDLTTRNGKVVDLAREQNLQHHTNTRTGEKLFRCDLCQKIFFRKSHLQQHLIVHNGEKIFECDSCEKSFTRKTSLQQHMRTHTGEKPFTCDLCNKSFAQKMTLTRHLLIHTERKPFKCDYCCKSFAEEDHLKQHVPTHTEVKSFDCDCCGKQYTSKQILRRHKLTHTGEKPYKCDCCEKSFILKHQLQQHMRTHTVEKPFECECCKKRFNQKSNLQRHLLTHGEQMQSDSKTRDSSRS